MGKFRVRFSTPQRVGEVMPPDVLVSEVVVEVDRMVLIRGDQSVQLDVQADAVADVRPVPEEDTSARKTRVRGVNEGSSWTDAEVAALRAAWDAGPKNTAHIRELAGDHGRSEGAIRARLKALGLVSWS